MLFGRKTTAPLGNTPRRGAEAHGYAKRKCPDEVREVSGRATLFERKTTAPLGNRTLNVGYGSPRLALRAQSFALREVVPAFAEANTYTRAQSFALREVVPAFAEANTYTRAQSFALREVVPAFAEANTYTRAQSFALREVVPAFAEANTYTLLLFGQAGTIMSLRFPHPVHLHRHFCG